MSSFRIASGLEMARIIKDKETNLYSRGKYLYELYFFPHSVITNPWVSCDYDMNKYTSPLVGSAHDEWMAIIDTMIDGYMRDKTNYIVKIDNCYYDFYADILESP